MSHRNSGKEDHFLLRRKKAENPQNQRTTPTLFRSRRDVAGPKQSFVCVAPAAWISCSNGASSANPAQKIKEIFAHPAAGLASHEALPGQEPDIRRPEP
jgi:hypothetical protein